MKRRTLYKILFAASVSLMLSSLSFYFGARIKSMIVSSDMAFDEAQSLTASQSAAKRTEGKSRTPAKLDSEKEWNLFKSRFGQNLTAEYATNGRLAVVHGNAGQGRKASSAFDVTDRQAAIQRAREVIEGAYDLLGINPNSPLADHPVARNSETSVQVYFRETRGGYPVEPNGQITVDLGKDGELLGLYSSYIPDIDIENSVNLGSDQAKVKAGQISVDTQIGLRAEGGRQILWVAQNSAMEAKAQGRIAYEFLIQGRQVVVDAGSGEILFSRDRRHF